MLIGVPKNTKGECSPYTGDALPPWPPVSARDNEPGFIPFVHKAQRVVPSPGPPGKVGRGDYTLFRTWNASDRAGNVVKASQEIVSKDTFPPQVVKTPSSFSGECGEPGLRENLLEWVRSFGGASAVDCSPVELSISVNADTIDVNSTFRRNVVITATDDKQQQTTMFVTMRVTDFTPPELTTPPTNVSVTCDRRQPQLEQLNEFIRDMGGAKFQDACAGQITTSIIKRKDGGCGNAHTVHFTIRAQDMLDNFIDVPVSFVIRNEAIPRLATSPEDLVIGCHETDASKLQSIERWLVRFGGAIMESDCSQVIVFDQPSISASRLLEVTQCGSDRQVTFTGRDPCDATLALSIDAVFRHSDLQPPVLTVGKVNETNLRAGQPFIGLPAVTAVDAVDGTIPVLVKGVSVLESALAEGRPGQYNVTLSATDSSGNIGRHIITYTVLQTAKSRGVSSTIVGSSIIAGLAALLALVLLLLFFMRRKKESFKADTPKPLAPQNRISLRRHTLSEYQNPLARDLKPAKPVLISSVYDSSNFAKPGSDSPRVVLSDAYDDSQTVATHWTPNASYDPTLASLPEYAEPATVYNIPMESSTDVYYSTPQGADAGGLYSTLQKP